MEHVSQGFREQLRADPRLLAAWVGLSFAAWVAVSWVIWDGLWAVASPQLWWAASWRLAAWLVVSFWLLFQLRHRPPGFALEGRLAWSGGHGEVVSTSGETVRGPVRILWQSPLLVGVSIDDPAAGSVVLWLTQRRLGKQGWWRLQRFLILAEH
ncbi:MAG TPA: hypothetical protein VK979_07990 [Guyparkeria sp.]|nr:hypothetical protein [Guyparkeria sp.]